jgi:L-alanine-DL-glutamate epimerase-like enolase superfamily enzyme
MKITNITTTRIQAPLKTPFVTALRRVEVLEDVVVMVETNSGAVGYGEGASTPIITGDTLGSIEGAISYLAPSLIGRDIEEFEEMLHIIATQIRHNTTAKSALEMALYDLKAKSQKLPLYQLLGGTSDSDQRVLTTDITISLGSVDQMLKESLHAISKGYKSLKIKLGTTPQEDIARIKAIAEVVDNPLLLRLDANQAWSAKQSVEILQAVEKEGIRAECIEHALKRHCLLMRVSLVLTMLVAF